MASSASERPRVRALIQRAGVAMLMTIDEHAAQVGLTMISTGCYLVVAGTAAALREPELIRQLWRPTYRAWFPDSKDDREATALRVSVNRVDYWEPPRSRLIRVVQAAKAVVTRRAVETPMKTITGL